MDQSSEIALNRCRRNSELLSGFSIEPLCNQLELFGILLDALNHIAMDISSVIGGIPSLTAACVIFTGMFGSTFNHKILSWLGFKNDIAIGLAIGASSHGLGTSACVNKSALQLAIGGVAIGLTGIATSILAPLLLPLLTNLF